MKSKGQASLDYLMTYGWAILLIILVAAALFTLGIFNVNLMLGNKAVGFTQVQVSGFRLVGSTTDATAKFTNEAGVPITLTYVNMTWVDKGITIYNDLNAIGPNANKTSLGVGKTSQELVLGTFNYYNLTPSPGDTFTMEMRVGYTDNKYGVDYVQYGTVNGVVQ